MGQDVQPFAFEDDLVRAVEIDGAPWFVARDVCKVLGIVKPDRALAALDEDEKGAHSMRTLGGKQDLSIVNESGLYALVFRSRKEKAKIFRKWVTSEVLPALRQTGRYEMPGRGEAASVPFTDGPVGERYSKIGAVKEARQLYGNAFARQLWTELGLPVFNTGSDIPNENDLTLNECLRLMLDRPIGRKDRRTVRQIHAAMIEQEITMREADAAVQKCGLALKYMPGMPRHRLNMALFVPNGGAALEKFMAHTAYHSGCWMDILRPALHPGVIACKFRIGGQGHRGRLVPPDLWPVAVQDEA